MHSHSITILKLGRPGHRNRGLYVTKAGVFLGPGRALARIWQDSNGRKSASIPSEADLAKLLTAAYGRRVETRLLRRELATLANALIEGNLFKATLRATYLAMPELPDEDATRRLLEAEEILKAGFNPDEPRDEHGRWTGDANSVSRQPPSPSSRSTSSQEIAGNDQDRHSRCEQECLHLLPSPSGDLQAMEFHRRYGECMRGLR